MVNFSGSLQNSLHYWSKTKVVNLIKQIKNRAVEDLIWSHLSIPSSFDTNHQICFVLSPLHLKVNFPTSKTVRFLKMSHCLFTCHATCHNKKPSESILMTSHTNHLQTIAIIAQYGGNDWMCTLLHQSPGCFMLLVHNEVSTAGWSQSCKTTTDV